MARVKSGAPTRARRKKILKMAKGYRGARSRTFQKAREAVTNALKDAYRDRKRRKRDFRSLWIVRINAAARAEGVSYSALVSGLKKAGVEVDRKILAELAVTEPAAFKKFVELAKQNAGSAAA